MSSEQQAIGRGTWVDTRENRRGQVLKVMNGEAIVSFGPKTEPVQIRVAWLRVASEQAGRPINKRLSRSHGRGKKKGEAG